jgi:RNA polymerase sigma factor (TIGR02999 family)
LESHDEVTRLLKDLNAGIEGAEEELINLLYSELHSLAQGYMRHERAGQTLQATALVNEAYLRLGGKDKSDWEDRAHFLRMAARAMRRILVDNARRKGAARRKAVGQRVPIDKAALYEDQPSAGLLCLDKALDFLTGLNPKMGQVVELRYFGGLSVEETARIMGVNPRTVARYWRMAKAWLAKEIKQDRGNS